MAFSTNRIVIINKLKWKLQRLWVSVRDGLR